MKSFLPLLLLVVACGRELALPEAPNDRTPPAVTAFAPAHAYAGWPLTITGERLGTRVDEVTVEFAGGAVARAESIDGNAVVVHVPLGAATGPLTLVTPAGRSAPTEAFVVDGRGAPANPQPLVQADLRPRLERVLERSEGLLLHDRDIYQRVATSLELGGEVRPVPGSEPLDIGVLDDAPVVLDSGAGCDADLVVVDALPAGPTERARIRLEEESTFTQVCYRPTTLAVGPSGLIAVAAWHTIWIVDPSAAQPVRATLTLSDDTVEFTSNLASAGSDRFVIGANNTLVVVAQTQGTWGLKAVDASAAIDGPFKALDATTDGRVAALSGYGEVGLFEVASASPYFLKTAPLSGSHEVISIALSDDGDNLVVADQAQGRVVTYTNIDSEMLPVGSVEVEGASRIDRASRGRWLVASLGGVAELAQRTGLLLGFVPIGAGLQGPVVRTGAPGEPDVVEVLSTSFHRIRRLEAAAFEEDARPLDVGTAVTSVAATFGAPGGRSLFVSIDEVGIEQYRGEDERRLLPFPARVVHGELHAVDAEERTLVVEAFVGAERVLAAWDLTQDAPPAPAPVSVGEQGYDFLHVGDERLLAVSLSGGFELLELAALRRGELVRVGAPVVLSDDSFLHLGSGISAGHAVVVGRSGPERTLHTWVLRLSDGALLTEWEAATGNAPTDELSFLPSLRFFASLTQFAGTTRFSIGTFDVESGVVGRGQPLLVLPGLNQRLAPTRTGERLYALDIDGDTLTLVQ